MSVIAVSAAGALVMLMIGCLIGQRLAERDAARRAPDQSRQLVYQWQDCSSNEIEFDFQIKRARPDGTRTSAATTTP